MAYDDDRRQLHDSLEAALGSRATETLMTYLPPVPWTEFATRTQLEGVRLELEGVRRELKGEIAELRGEMRQGFGELRGELGKLIGRMDAMTAKIIVGNVATGSALVALVLGASRLL